MKAINEYLQNSKTDYLLDICANHVNIRNLELEESILSELHTLAKKSKTNSNFFIATSLIWAIDLSSIPVDVAWATLDLGDLGQSAKLFALGGIILTFTLAICTAIYIYQISVKENEDNQCLTILKNKICEELKNRIPDNKKTDETQSKPLVTSNQKKLKDSLFAGLAGTSCAVILFTTFYWGTSDILELLGYENAANFMTDSACMSCAIALIISFSLYLGYQHFLGPNNNPAVSAENSTKEGSSSLQDAGTTSLRSLINEP